MAQRWSPACFCVSAQRPGRETRALLCCYQAVNWYYYKYTVDGINVFAVSILRRSVSVLLTPAEMLVHL